MPDIEPVAPNRIKRLLFGVFNSGTHPIKFAGEEIFSVAHELTRLSLEHWSQERFSVYHTSNLYTEGLASLGSERSEVQRRVCAGNCGHVDINERARRR